MIDFISLLFCFLLALVISKTNLVSEKMAIITALLGWTVSLYLSERGGGWLMVKVILFITPEVIAKISSKSIEFRPVISWSLDLSRKAVKLTKLSDLVSSATLAVGTMFEFSFGKIIAISIECTLWPSLSIAGGLISNPTITASGWSFSSMVIL